MGRVRRILRWLAIGAGVLVILLLAGGLWVRSRLVASLPQLDGEREVSGLGADVTIRFDDLGVPSVHAADRIDLAQAVGFLHAQNRFFQMDLMRRQAAGELAGLFGAGLVNADRRNRVHRFRARAEAILDGLPEDDRRELQAYADGVNAGLAALGAPPFAYQVIRSEPVAWSAEDSVLAILSMFVMLDDNDGSRDSAVGLMHDLLPGPLFAFLVPPGTEWDAPIVGEAFETPPVPGPDVFDLRSSGVPAGTVQAEAAPAGDEGGWEEAAGSNNWAVAGALTADGGALLANDMHLPLGVPNIWYRASLSTDDGIGAVTGVTLPGVPVVVVGSNTHVAWGFTNSYGDWVDLVIVERDPDDPNRYLAPDGPLPFEHHAETIQVAGGDNETLDVVTTIWGPIIDQDYLGRPRALRWIAYDDGAVDTGLSRMATAGTLEEALTVGETSGLPPQNMLVADDTGRIGWTIAGAMPRRVGFPAPLAERLPMSWADGVHRWDGWLDPEEYPRLVDPPGGLLWTANARVADGWMLAAIGDGGYPSGARAGQIRDDLRGLDRPAAGDMLDIQLDDRALFLTRWHDLLLETLSDAAVAADPRRARLRRLVETWGGRAAIDSAGYRMVRAFRYFLARQTFDAITAACRKADPRFDYLITAQEEGPLWRLVTERPMHLLDPKFDSWDTALLAAVDTTIDTMERDGFTLEDRTWGRRNTTRIRHPLSLGVPMLSSWLDMPAVPLPGDSDMPRFQAPSDGASERMVVSPGREAMGLFHMPCGQSGHPMSPHYRDGHAAWEQGAPTPFLPGPPVHTLTLHPAR